MKNLALTLALLITLGTSKIITIIDNGVERKINIEVNTSIVKTRSVNSKSKGIIIAFKNSQVNVLEFSKKYKIKLKKRLKIGYYIFENNSLNSDIELISKILKENKKLIKTIRPNWGFGMGIR